MSIYSNLGFIFEEVVFWEVWLNGFLGWEIILIYGLLFWGSIRVRGICIFFKKSVVVN